MSFRNNRNEKENGRWEGYWTDWWLNDYEVGVLLGNAIVKKTWIKNVPDLASWLAGSFNHYYIKHCLYHGWLIN